MKAIFTITADEVINQGCWVELCDLKGWNVWVVNEGLMDSEEKIELTMGEAQSLGLVPK